MSMAISRLVVLLSAFQYRLRALEAWAVAESTATAGGGDIRSGRASSCPSVRERCTGLFTTARAEMVRGSMLALDSEWMLLVALVKQVAMAVLANG